MRVLVACEFSGRVRDAFINAGHEAMSCDLLPTESPGPHYQGDIFDIITDGWDLMVAHPPCTYLTVTANKWFTPENLEKEPWRIQARLDAMKFFKALWNAPIPHKALENPIGIMSTRWQKPSQIIQPWWFGHPETKATCLWLSTLPPLHPTNPVAIPEEPRLRMRVNYLPNTPDRWKLRSLTFQGVADAMAEQWGNMPKGYRVDGVNY